MYRFVRTTPGCVKLYTRFHKGPSRFTKVVRQYAKKQDQGTMADFCPPKPKKSNAWKYWTLGAITVIGGTLGYAKYDPDFRDFLVGILPFVDDILKFVFQEERSYGENIMLQLEKIQVAIMKALGFEAPPEPEEPDVDVKEESRCSTAPSPVNEPQKPKK